MVIFVNQILKLAFVSVASVSVKLTQLYYIAIKLQLKLAHFSHLLSILPRLKIKPIHGENHIMIILCDVSVLFILFFECFQSENPSLVLLFIFYLFIHCF